MTLRSRLAAGLVIIAIILVAPLAWTLQSLSRLQADAAALRDREFAASLLIGRLREGLNEVRRAELALLFARNAVSRDAMEKDVAHVGALADSLGHYALGAYAQTIGTSVRELAAVAPAEYGAALAGNTKLADSLSLKSFVPALNYADSTVKIAEHELQNRTSERVNQQSTAIVRAATMSGTALILALVLAAAIAIWLTRSISQPILDLRAGMSAVADGDLNYKLRIPSDRGDEFGRLAEDFKEMVRQLGELDKLKAEFVSVASHELKTPINVILGYLQLIDEGVYGPVPEKQRDVQHILAVQANNLHRLVKQLLDVSRFEAGGGRVEPRRMELEPFLSELDDAFHVLAVQREVNWHIRRGDDLPPEVNWDADRVNEVLGNLLSNAFKFTPKGGTIELIVERVNDNVRMQVRDTGAGIPAEQLPRIFDKFYQADNQGSAHAKGTGLGLAIAKQIVDAHGGTITCESTQGVGTTFVITLPTRVQRRSSIQRAVTV